MIEELTDVTAWLADRAPLRALIVTGAGDAFCAGGDINWFRKGVEDPDVDISVNVRRGAEALHQGDRRLPPHRGAGDRRRSTARRRAPGFSLALACDIRIAAEDAFFAPAYGRIGASPDGGMTYFLPRVVGPAKAMELMLEDPNLTAADALAWACHRGRARPRS